MSTCLNSHQGEYPSVLNVWEIGAIAPDAMPDIHLQKLVSNIDAAILRREHRIGVFGRHRVSCAHAPSFAPRGSNACVFAVPYLGTSGGGAFV